LLPLLDPLLEVPSLSSSLDVDEPPDEDMSSPPVVVSFVLALMPFVWTFDLAFDSESLELSELSDSVSLSLLLEMSIGALVLDFFVFFDGSDRI